MDGISELHCRHCDACVAYCKDAIRNQPGVESYEISLKDQRVTVTGKVAPSRIARALKKDGRQVIVKGTGTMDAGNDGTEVRCLSAVPSSYLSVTLDPSDLRSCDETVANRPLSASSRATRQQRLWSLGDSRMYTALREWSVPSRIQIGLERRI